MFHLAERVAELEGVTGKVERLMRAVELEAEARSAVASSQSGDRD